MQFTIHNQLEEIPLLADRVTAFLADQGVPDETIMTINLCLDELLTNTIEYGYSDLQRHTIGIDMRLHNSELSIEIIDDAAPFDPTLAAPPSSLDEPIESRPIGGLGLFLVRKFTDLIQYSRQHERNHLTLKKRLSENT
jgi:anti-sigma regulatory factor (Ser/Thr protein kinase)